MTMRPGKTHFPQPIFEYSRSIVDDTPSVLGITTTCFPFASHYAMAFWKPE